MHTRRVEKQAQDVCNDFYPNSSEPRSIRASFRLQALRDMLKP